MAESFDVIINPGAWRRCLIAMGILASLGLASGAQAQKLEATPELSIAEARSLLACKTLMTFYPGHGTQIFYLRPDGTEFLWYPGNAVVLRAKWDIVQRATLTQPPRGYAAICFQYGTNTYNPVTQQTGGKWECRPAYILVRSIVDSAAGDVFRLASRTAPPFALPRERTTIADLRKNIPPSDLARPTPGRDPGCGEIAAAHQHVVTLER